MEVVDQDIRTLWDDQGLCADAKRLWVHRSEGKGRLPRDGYNLDSKERSLIRISRTSVGRSLRAK